MPTFAQAIDLVDDPAVIAEYERHHRAVWPEVVAALLGMGLRELRIFRLGNRLVMVYEAPEGFNPARDYERYAADPRCREWDALMRRYQRPAPGARTGEWWASMELVFELGGA